VDVETSGASVGCEAKLRPGRDIMTARELQL
jgi:hypothetical protein